VSDERPAFLYHDSENTKRPYTRDESPSTRDALEGALSLAFADCDLKCSERVWVQLCASLTKHARLNGVIS